MTNANIKSKRHAMLGKLFIEGTAHGLSQDFIRDVVAPGLIGKRLSAASEKEISLVITHVAGSQLRKPAKKFASSMQGLRDEIKDLAKARWGESWSGSLNNLCRRFGIEHYNFLDLAHGKAVKQRLVTWEDKTHPHPGPLPEGEGVKNEEVPF